MRQDVKDENAMNEMTVDIQYILLYIIISQR